MLCRHVIRLLMFACLLHIGSVSAWTATEPHVVPQVLHYEDVRGLAFFPNGTTIATASYDGTIKIWNVSSGALIHTIFAHDQYASSVAISSDGKMLLSGGWDGFVKSWDTTTWKPIRSFRYGEFVDSIALSANDSTILAGGHGGIAKLWEVSTGKALGSVRLENDNVGSLAFSPDGKSFLVGGSYAGVLSLYDTATLRRLKTHAQSSNPKTRHPIHSVSFSSDGMLGVVGSSDRTLTVWDIEKWSVKKSLPHSSLVLSGNISKDNRYIFLGGYDKVLKVFDLEKGFDAGHFPQAGEARAIAVSPTGHAIASVSQNGDVLVLKKMPGGEWEVGTKLETRGGKATHGACLYA